MTKQLIACLVGIAMCVGCTKDQQLINKIDGKYKITQIRFKANNFDSVAVYTKSFFTFPRYRDRSTDDTKKMVTYNIENEPTVSRLTLINDLDTYNELSLTGGGIEFLTVPLDGKFFLTVKDKKNIELYSTQPRTITEIHGNDTTIKSYKLVVYLLKE